MEIEAFPSIIPVLQAYVRRPKETLLTTSQT